MSAEEGRLREDAERRVDWKRWGPYLAERQWATVREDYSADGDSWGSFPHDHARSRAYRWGEDGLLGVCDRQGRLCLALAMWNGRDPILKERLFGLTGPEGNHGEDAKECWWYLDSTPTHSYFQGLYRYPRREFPYADLVEENGRRTREDPEYELLDTGAFDEGFWDVVAEYAKAGPDDLLLRVRVENHGSEAGELHLLPTLWFRNTWSWGRTGEGYGGRPSLRRVGSGRVAVEHETLGRLTWAVEGPCDLLFTENETNRARLYGASNPVPHVKDAFHERVVHGVVGAVNPAGEGTKCAAWYRLQVPAGGAAEVRVRLYEGTGEPFGDGFTEVLQDRRREADEFYATRIPSGLPEEETRVARLAYAGLLWSKQHYHYVVREWLEGDPASPPPPASRWEGRNADWQWHLYNRDVLSMPDKWEYPWYAAWDLAFHAAVLCRVDPYLAREQLILLLREWYLHPNGQVPAYEFNFGDVNPPVHAWAALRVFRADPDPSFLARVFQKLLLNFTWWVNRTDRHGLNVFSGGFLGLDNIGVFDRSHFPEELGELEQADATAWMAFYCLRMLRTALELARTDPVYEDVASKFFEHFVAIQEAMNTLGGSGLWDEQDGFYYDVIRHGGDGYPLRVRSLVGLLPVLAAEVLDLEQIRGLEGFNHRLEWFLRWRPDLAGHVRMRGNRLLLAVTPEDRLVRVLSRMLDEGEFLSPHGIRSLSRYHADHPYVLRLGDEEHRVDYEPAESRTPMFGGNSNWRGPVWLPVNYLFIEALKRLHHFYGDDLQVECPVGSGRTMSLRDVATELERRVVSLFLPDASGRRPCHGDDPRYATDPLWRDKVLFYEYFDGDTGRGLGASHQTGWTALVARMIEKLARDSS